MIEVANLVKDYGPIRALNQVSFQVSKGEVVGFLGPNGAGKTTCMKIITGFIAASSGSVKVDGRDVVEHGVEVRRRLGYLPENAPVYQDMTVREYLAFVAEIRGVSKDQVKRRIQDVAMTVGVLNVLDQEISTLSKGYRQRAGLAQAMIHNPEILILDEPTSGLDPNQIVEIRQLIKEVGRDRTVILSTHNLPEVTATCNRIIVIHRGKIAADGTPAQIRERHGGGNTVRVELARGNGAELAATVLGRLEHVRSALLLEEPEAGPDRGVGELAFRVDAAGDADVRPAIFDAAVKAGWGLVELRRERLELETIFQRLTLS